MKEDEIRFRFLFGLYQKNNGEHTSELTDTNEIIKLSDLEEIEGNLLIQQITYLNKEGLIGGDYADGKILPAYVSTTNWGIETVEQIMDESLSKFLNSVDDKTKKEIESINLEENTAKRYLELCEYADHNLKLLTIINEKLVKLISDPGF